jgi:hypothetical protein
MRPARDVVNGNTRKLLYCAVVRPKLEYASCVWSPYSAKQRKLIENVQHRATKFILNYPPRDVTYRHRRELYDLTLLYKIKNNLINVTFNQYLTPATTVTPMPHATSTLTNYNKIVSNNSSDNPISHASSGTIYHRTSKLPIPYRSSRTIYTLITKPNCLPTYHAP